MEYTIHSENGMQLGKKISARPSSDICMQDDDFLKLDGDHRNEQITALEGTLWVTQQSDLEDYLLQPYQTFTVSSAGTVLVQALENGKVRITQK